MSAEIRESYDLLARLLAAPLTKREPVESRY